MRIIYHLGAHGTDDGKLVRGLLRDKALLNARGIAVPSPRSYRTLLFRLAEQLRGSAADEDARQMILDAVLGDEDRAPGTLIFSGEQLACFPMQVVTDRGFYAPLPRKFAAYANIFPYEDNAFFLALRNPATMIPDLIAKAKSGTYDAVMAGQDPRNLRWFPVIRQILEALPGVRLTLWCDEDAPLLWPDVLRRMTGLPADVALAADSERLAPVMQPEAMARLEAYLATHAIGDLPKRRKIAAAFLERFADPDAVSMDLPLPGWSEALVATITSAYEEDCDRIAALPGVTFLIP